jgi:prephenate dehydratase
MKLYYLGPEGTFSHDAATKLLSHIDAGATLSAQSNVEAVVRSVAGSLAEPAIGLVPYYNLLEGLVQEHLDLLYEFRLRIVGVIRLAIQLSAGSFDDPPTSAKEVFSHPKALAQVSGFLQANLKDATFVAVNSTSEGARIVAERKQGVAIASETGLKKFGVPIFARDIGNLSHGKSNFTDFFVVRGAGAGPAIELGAPNHVMIAITPRIDRPGLLAELLGQFHFYDLDIAKIHSRPAIDQAESAEEPQMFYLEVKSPPDADSLLRCLDAIRYRFGRDKSASELVRVIGGFRVA